MKHSETFAKLSAALVAAQAQIKGVAKNSTNPHFKSKYASLDDIVAAVRPVLASHKLAIVQGACDPIIDHGGSLEGFSVETMLVHESGEWIANAAIVPLTKVDAQGAGGAMTYGRRYGLSALLSLATDEDDDGNVASTPRQQAARSNGAAVMPFGKTKGKPLTEHTSEELQKTVAWCRERGKFTDLVEAIGVILADRAQESAL